MRKFSNAAIKSFRASDDTFEWLWNVYEDFTKKPPDLNDSSWIRDYEMGGVERVLMALIDRRANELLKEGKAADEPS